MYKKLFCRVFATQHVTCQSQEEAELVLASAKGTSWTWQNVFFGPSLPNEQHVSQKKWRMGDQERWFAIFMYISKPFMVYLFKGHFQIMRIAWNTAKCASRCLPALARLWLCMSLCNVIMCLHASKQAFRKDTQQPSACFNCINECIKYSRDQTVKYGLLPAGTMWAINSFGILVVVYVLIISIISVCLIISFK